MQDRLFDAVAPLLMRQRRTDKWASLDDCIDQARDHGVRPDLVVLLVRAELPLAARDRSRLFPHLVVNVGTSRGGAIYRDDVEALEALELVAEALDKTIIVNVIDR
jgi:hypothetical protein